MLSELIYNHLITSEVFNEKLAKYNDRPAVFNQRAPDDMTQDWEKQLPRIVFRINMNTDPERKESGTLQVFVYSLNTAMAEDLGIEVRNMLDGYFFSENTDTYSVQWDNTGYLTEPDSPICTTAAVFRILAFPSQLTGAIRDPALALCRFTKDIMPNAFIIGYDTLPNVWRAEDNPAVYWRIGERSVDTELSVYAATFFNVQINGHVFSGDTSVKNSAVQTIIFELNREKALKFNDGSWIRVDWDNRANINADEYRVGQIANRSLYCEQTKEDYETMNDIYIS